MFQELETINCQSGRATRFEFPDVLHPCVFPFLLSNFNVEGRKGKITNNDGKSFQKQLALDCQKAKEILK